MSPRYPRPTRVVTRRLLARYHEQGDLRARDRVIREYLPFAHLLAQKFSDRGETLEDLRQVSSVGLIKAVDRFDINRESDFFAFAKQYILGELKHHFRDNGWVMHVTRGMQELQKAVSGFVAAEIEKTGVAPPLEEISKALGTPEDKVSEALLLSRAYNLASLNEPNSYDDPDGETVMDVQADEDRWTDAMGERLLIEEALANLDQDQQEILNLRFNEGKKKHEIAKTLGISREHVTEVLVGTIKVLRSGVRRTRMAGPRRTQVNPL
jgi:RNA polymerase sigma-B factor